MDPVYVDESATAAVGSHVAQMAVQGLSSASAVAGPLTAIPPAGSDLVSMQAAAAFAAMGTQMLALDTQAQDFIAQAGATLTHVAATYGALDGASATSLAASGTLIAATPTATLGPALNPNTPVITPGAPVNPLTPVAPPTPLDPSGPVTPVTPGGTPLTPIAPPTPLNPNGPVMPVTPVTPTDPSAPLTPMTPLTPVAPADSEASAAADTGTGVFIPTTGTIPGGAGASTTPAVTPARPGTDARRDSARAADRASRTSQSTSDTAAVPTPVQSPTTATSTAASTAAASQTAAAATDAATEAAAAPVELAAAVPVDPMLGVRPATAAGALSGMTRPAGAVAPAAGGAVDEVAAGALAAGAPEAAPAGAAAGAAAAGAAPTMPVAPASSGSASAGAGSPSRNAGVSTPPPNSPPSASAARVGERDDWTDSAAVPVAASLAARDAIASADASRRQGVDVLRLARRVAAALHAPDSLEGEDSTFFWVTAVTADDRIVVANNFGLAYIPAGVALPETVQMATADPEIPVAERAGWVPDPVKAVRGWAAHHGTTLTALIATEEGASGCAEESIAVVIKPDEIPDSGAMEGRTRLHVVDPDAAQRVIAATHEELPGLLPAEQTTAASDAPAARHAAGSDNASTEPTTPSAERPQPDNARDITHFRLRVGTAHRIALRRARAAADVAAQRDGITEWLYWRHLVELAEDATAAAHSG